MRNYTTGPGKADLIRVREIAEELLNAHDMDEDARLLTYGEKSLVLLAQRAIELLGRYVEDQS